MSKNGMKILVYFNRYTKKASCQICSVTIDFLKEKARDEKSKNKPTHYFQDLYDRVVKKEPGMVEKKVISICRTELNRIVEPYYFELFKEIDKCVTK